MLYMLVEQRKKKQKLLKDHLKKKKNQNLTKILLQPEKNKDNIEGNLN